MLILTRVPTRVLMVMFTRVILTPSGVNGQEND